MRHSLTITDPATRLPKAGYTVKVYNYTSTPPYYTGTAVYTMTDAGNGIYYMDSTRSFVGTVVVTAPGSTSVFVPESGIKRLFIGDDYPMIQPTT
jgi:hypothetical protein